MRFPENTFLSVQNPQNHAGALEKGDSRCYFTASNQTLNIMTTNKKLSFERIEIVKDHFSTTPLHYHCCDLNPPGDGKNLDWFTFVPAVPNVSDGSKCARPCNPAMEKQLGMKKR